MPRSRSRAAPRRPAPARRAAPKAAPPAQQQSGGGGMMGGLGGMIAQGMAFGTGSAIAHRAVGAVAGAMGGDDDEGAERQDGGAAPAQQQQQQNPCMEPMMQFNQCVGSNGADISMCQSLYQSLQECQSQVNMAAMQNGGGGGQQFS